MVATFRHKVTGEEFTAETFSVDDSGSVRLQRFRVGGALILDGDAEIVADAVNPADDDAVRMLAQAADVVRSNGDAPPDFLANFLRDGLTGFAMRKGAAIAADMVKVRNARACSRCGAAVGEWCRVGVEESEYGSGLTIHSERRVEQP